MHWGLLLLGLAFFGLNLTLRSRAFFNSLRAAYPAAAIKWRRIWGAYFAAVGFNNVVPARGGDIIKLFLARSSIPGSSYPTVAAAFFVEAVFDVSVGVFVLIFAFTPGRVSQAAGLRQAELLRHLLPRRALPPHAVPDHRAGDTRPGRLRAAVGARAGVLGARAPGRDDPERSPPLPARGRRLAGGSAWLCRFAAFWFLLEAFRVGGSVENVLLVFGVNQVAGAVPFTPGGAGVQQALLVKVFATSAPTAVVAAYSVGQQIAIAVFTALVGLGAVIFIFRFRSFREVLHAGRASREAERAGRARRGAAATPRGASTRFAPARPRPRGRTGVAY